ncbi:beta-carotene 15,15'-monooxygenase [Corynebacterium sp. HMSC071F07]|nr:beta-carotene 15,15'-monooxygenase [Corynebacterium sp. HMSC071F07]OFM01467.1 beta-carotene 15,15'-monooxygenase [Corynebacterium sp. HMSC071F07]
MIAACVIGFWVVAGIVINIASHLGASVAWWDLIHPFTIGAMTTAIIVYSTHFTEALTRMQARGYKGVAWRVGIVQVGLVLLLVDRAGFDWGPLSDAASLLIIATFCWHGFDIYRALRGSLAGLFAVTVPFYIAAAAFVIVSVLLVVLAANGVGNYSLLVAAHSRGMVWGFAWLTIVATVVTLLPTLSGTKIAPAARARCTRALIVHCVGLALALGLNSFGLSRAAGMTQLLVVLAALLIIQPILATLLAGKPQLTTATVSVVAGLLWMLSLCAADAVCAILGVYPRVVTLLLMPAFVGAGLMQLVTGVLHHLLPTLVGGGPAKVTLGRKVADYGGYARLVLINLGAMLCLLGADIAGLIMMGLGLITNILAIAVAVSKQKRLEN